MACYRTHSDNRPSSVCWWENMTAHTQVCEWERNERGEIEREKERKEILWECRSMWIRYFSELCNQTQLNRMVFLSNSCNSLFFSLSNSLFLSLSNSLFLSLSNSLSHFPFSLSQKLFGTKARNTPSARHILWPYWMCPNLPSGNVRVVAHWARKSQETQAIPEFDATYCHLVMLNHPIAKSSHKVPFKP